MKRFIPILVAGLVYGADFAQAGCIHLSAQSEALIKSADPNTNFGNTSKLTVGVDPAKGKTPVNWNKQYIRYDLTGLVSPFTSLTISIKLFANDPVADSPVTYDTFNIYGLLDSAAGDNWVETGASGITWNNAPGNDTSSPNLMDPSKTSLLATFTVPSNAQKNDVIQFTSTALLDFFNNSGTDNLVTLIMTPADSSVVSHTFFSGKNVGSGPGGGSSIEGDLAIGPEPGTLTLAGLGLAILLGHAGISRLLSRRRLA